MLLRTDSFGATSTTTNICSSCHNRSNHATYNGTINIQCVDCHSGHVEYISDEDKALAASNPSLYGDYAKPNVYMLRRYMNWSSGTRLSTYRKKAFLTSTSSTAVYRNDTNTTICQACHKLPTNVVEHKTATTAAQCDVCHGDLAHATQPPAVPVGCSACHGSPPQHSVAGTITYATVPSGGYAVYSSQNNVTKITKSYLLSSGVYKNESTAGHATHAAGKPYTFACAACHSGNSHGDHGTQTYQDVFISKPSNSPSAAYNTVTKSRSTCSNLYCHSYGMATVTKPKFAVWSGGNAGGVRGTFLNAGDNRCVKCHNVVNTTYNNMSTNSHFRHVSKVTTTGKVYSCNYCHNATVNSSGAISDYSKHSNGSRELVIDGTQISGKVAGSSLSATSCTTYCHTDGVVTTPVVTLNWTDRNTGKCDSCHRTATNTYGTPGQLASNAHFAHISSSYGPRLRTNTQCSSCHVYTTELASTHIDGAISKNSGNNFCLNCHAMKTPTWIAPVRQTCQSCHSGIGTNGLENPANISWSSYNGTGVRAVYKSYSTFTNRGHGKFSVMDCTACHNRNSAHINGATSQAGTYRGARIFGIYSGMSVYGADKLCVVCHNDAGNGGSTTIVNTKRINLKSHVVDRTPNFSYCIACHDTHGSSNAMNMKKVFNVMTGNGRGPAIKNVVFTNFTTGFVNAQRTGLCQVCHTNTTAYRNYTATTGIYVGTVSYKGSWTHNGNSKRCLTCHFHNDATYAFKPSSSGECNGCHGYPPRLGDGKNNPTASSNIHDSHRMTGKNITDDWSGTATGMACITCHTGHAINPVSASISVPTNVFVTGSTTYNTTTSTCSNINCHFKASPAWK
jgi:predicted CxxxxCH...CXXCH cytochrome family protein